LSEYVYYNKQTSSQEEQQLLLQAHEWVDVLEKLL